MKPSKISYTLLLTYLLTLPLTKLLHHPLTGYAIQLPELIFILLAAVSVVSKELRKSIWCRPLELIDYGILTLLIAQFIVAILYKQWWGNMPWWGLVYLAVLYHITRGILTHVSLTQWHKSVQYFAAVLVASIACSYLYIIFWPNGSWVLASQKYFSFIGHIWRVEAFTMSPNMLMNILLLPFLVALLYYWKQPTKKKALALGLLTLAVCTTASKSIILLLVVIVLLWRKHLNDRFRLLSRILALGLVGIFLFLTKTVTVSKSQPDPILLQQSYMTDHLLWSNATTELYASMHYRMNQEAWQAFLSAPFIGIGFGDFTNWIDQRKEQGLYPKNKISYGPHSLYLGVLAESGLIGFSALCFFLYTLMVSIRQKWQNATWNKDYLLYALSAYLFVWLLDGLAMDTLHFRQFWLILAALLAYPLRVLQNNN